LSGIFTTDSVNATKEERFRVSALAEHFVHYLRGAKKKTFVSNLLLSEKAETRTGGGNGDDDSVSDIYTTDGAAAVDSSKLQGARTRTAFTPGAPTPGADVAVNKSKAIFRSSSSSSNLSPDTASFKIHAPPSDDDSMSEIYTTDGVSMPQEQDEAFQSQRAWRRTQDSQGILSG
jgi:hypothetical protein